MESLQVLIESYEAGETLALAAVTFALFFAGAAFASFAGLAATRIGSVPEGASILAALSRPPSRCDGCGARLPAWALVPVLGWVAARGRHSCGAKVSPAYPAVEFLAGAATAAAPAVAGGLGLEAASLVLVGWTCLLASWIDVREHVIPEELTWPLLFAGLLLSPFEPDAWTRAAGAAVCCGSMWLSLAAVGWARGLDTRAGGDVALAAAAGGWLGLDGAVPFLLGASLAFVLHALPARMRGVEWVPMGPALSISLVCCAAFWRFLPYA